MTVPGRKVSDQENWWDKPVTVLKGVGRVRAKELASLGVKTVGDLLRHFPRRYEDLREIKRIAETQAGERVGVRGQVVAFREQPARQRKRLIISRALVDDGTGQMGLLWFTHGWRLPSPLAQRLRPGVEITVFGRVEMEGGLRLIKNPSWDLTGSETSLHVGRIVPIYPLTGGLTNKYLRVLIHSALAAGEEDLEEELPLPLRERLALPSRLEALRMVHFPRDWHELELGRRALAVAELLRLQLALTWRRRERTTQVQGIPQPAEGELVERFLANLPFSLTQAQERARQEIFRDMSSPRPMDRLLQGDVGTGKTVVAALAMVKAVANGFQAAMMVPTGILAEQHYQTLRGWLEPLGVTVALLTGEVPKAKRQEILAGLASGEIQVVVGTHALLGEEVTFAALSLVVADEQHRFGVLQRQRLWAKGRYPDVLIMSATPIPRTLAQILYGDLEISVLDQPLPGRRPVVTRWIREDQRPRVYAFLKKYLSAGHQAYLVCPRIEEGEEEGRGVVTVAEELKQEFAGFAVGVLHGQLPAAAKEEVMRQFRDGKIQLLIATTVIENGIDVPSATIMVVEEADRFGLAQLHQLRGRVGRGDRQSYCILLAEPRTPEAVERLQAMVAYSDGRILAEKDLKLRGPGEIFGLRQHGMPELGLRLADPFRDLDLLDLARREAELIIEQDPYLTDPAHQVLRREVEKLYHLALTTPVTV